MYYCANALKFLTEMAGRSKIEPIQASTAGGSFESNAPYGKKQQRRTSTKPIVIALSGENEADVTLAAELTEIAHPQADGDRPRS